MYDYTFLLPISAFLLLGVMIPGPSFILVAQTAMAKSRSDAIAVALGMGVGSTVFAIIASIGLFSLLETVPSAYIVLKVLGGVYLCFLSYTMWLHSKAPISQSTVNNCSSSGRFNMFLVGLLTQLSNPKTAIVFGSAFAAFLPKDVPAFSYYLISATAFIIDSVWYIFIATVLSTVKAQQTYSMFRQYICKIASGFMGFMGVKLLSSQQVP